MRTTSSPAAPKLDAIIFRIMPETAAQSAALETGAIDLVWNLPPDVIDQFKKNNKVVIELGTHHDVGRADHELSPKAF